MMQVVDRSHWRGRCCVGTTWLWLTILLPVLFLTRPCRAEESENATENATEQAQEAQLLSHVRQLTFAGRRTGEGYFSADGQSIVFQSERDPQNPFYQIFRMDLELGDTERISPGIGKTTCAWIHPDNQRVLFASTHEDPNAQQKQKEELEFRASGQERRYSWDYDEHFEVYEYNGQTKAYRNLTQSPGYDAEGSYSPDGKLIAFASNRSAYGDTADPLTDADREILEQDLAYMMEIYLMNADGSNVRRLTHTRGYDGGPFFSPNGQQICWRRFSPNGA
ncbi:MAG: PD40 domain-containing protein, partial [Planctomycetales bacterium]|nr:PD40 domain-containing protein [Planctomycetales bacterium]